MKQLFYCLAAITILAGCAGETYKKTKNGIEYKIIGGGSGDKLEKLYGQFIQIRAKDWYDTGKKDSVMNAAQNAFDNIIKFDSVSTPIVFYNIYKNLRKGDSLVMRILVDSAFKGSPQMMALYKKGHYLYRSVKLVNIFKTGEEAQAANEVVMKEGQIKATQVYFDKIKEDLKENAAQMKTDDVLIVNYLQKNNITNAIKKPWGTHVVVTSEGSGPVIDENSVVSVNYSGRTLSGEKFDSNVDSAFGHIQPITVNMSQPNVIGGWIDGLKGLKQGTKAVFYIPSIIGYGAAGNGGSIKPYDVLIFDMEILKVISKSEADAQAKAAQEKAEAEGKRFMDSLKNAAIQDSIKKAKGGK